MTDQPQGAPPPQTVVNVHMVNTNQATAEASAVAAAAPQIPTVPPERRSVLFAYLMLLLGFWGGFHRAYLERRVGLWLFFFLPFALMGFALWRAGAGIVVLLPAAVFLFFDLVSIPRWVRAHNATIGRPTARAAALEARPTAKAFSTTGTPPPPNPAKHPEPRKDLRTLLLHEAHRGDGRLTVTQGVMATGMDWERVENCLRDMVQAGYVDVDNEPRSGAIVYVFPELVGRPRITEAEPQPDDPADTLPC